MRLLCHALNIHPSGYYEWLKQPASKREQQDKRLLSSIKQFWLESGGHYGYRNIYSDLQEAKIPSGRDRVLRLMRLAGIKAQRGYRVPRGYYSGTPDIIAPNKLQRNFVVEAPNQWWVGDIPYIHTHEGFLFLAVVMDLYARNIVGWSMSRCQNRQVVLQAVLMALWQREARQPMILHPHRGCQFTSGESQLFLMGHNLTCSKSGVDAYADNAA